jgi:uncharacterized protein
MMASVMVLDLHGIRGSEEQVDRVYPSSAFSTEVDADYILARAVRLTLKVRKDYDKYQLVGRLRTTVRQTCCRCLDGFDESVDLAVDLLYLPKSANQGEAESEIVDEDLTTAFYTDDEIDLGQLVREQLQLTLLMKPLCYGKCRGLCPMCGINLNKECCECTAEWRDPRLAALRTLVPDRRE